MEVHIIATKVVVEMVEVVVEVVEVEVVIHGAGGSRKYWSWRNHSRIWWWWRKMVELLVEVEAVVVVLVVPMVYRLTLVVNPAMVVVERQIFLVSTRCYGPGGGGIWLWWWRRWGLSGLVVELDLVVVVEGGDGGDNGPFNNWWRSGMVNN